MGSGARKTCPPQIKFASYKYAGTLSNEALAPWQIYSNFQTQGWDNGGPQRAQNSRIRASQPQSSEKSILMFSPIPRYFENNGKHGMERWARTITASFIGIGNGAARTPEAQELDAGGHNIVQHRPPSCASIYFVSKGICCTM